jgi:cell division transport system permease protein
MLLQKIKRIFKTAFSSFMRNGTINIATTGIMAVTLLSISILLILNFLGNRTIENFKNKVDISIYFFSDTPDSDIDKVKDDLAALPEVKSISYLSKDEAWERFKEKYANNPVISEGIKELDVNPLYATMSIKARNIDEYGGINEFLSKSEYAGIISKINFEQNKSQIDKLASFTKSIQNGGLGVSLVFSIISIFVVFNAIRITIHNYRKEIKIMGLVGAENWYVELPFIIEGALYGVIGSIVSMIILAILIYFSAGTIDRLLGDITLVSYVKQNIVFIFGIQLIGGIFIGVLSSVFAMRKYLKV